MIKPNYKCTGLFFVILMISVLGCTGGTRGRLPRVETPTSSELRQDWHNYKVFFRGNIAFVYKLRDDKQIILDSQWAEITTGKMMAESKIWDTTWVRKIIGQNDQMFGYLVQRAADNANVKIINASTVQLYYHYVRTSGGP